MKDRFRYLNVGLGFILGFVGLKMLLTDVFHTPTWVSLLVIIVILAISVVASVRADRRGVAHRGARAEGAVTVLPEAEE
jgi:tellurite resistance protein TerC